MTLARVQMPFGEPTFTLAVCPCTGLEKGHADKAFVYLANLTSFECLLQATFGMMPQISTLKPLSTLYGYEDIYWILFFHT